MRRHMHDDCELVDYAYCLAASIVGLALGRGRVNIYTHSLWGKHGHLAWVKATGNHWIVANRLLEIVSSTKI